jgi:hypothetical protein
MKVAAIAGSIILASTVSTLAADMAVKAPIAPLS